MESIATRASARMVILVIIVMLTSMNASPLLAFTVTTRSFSKLKIEYVDIKTAVFEFSGYLLRLFNNTRSNSKV